MDRTEFLGVSLEVAAHQGEVLVDPDEDAAAEELAVVATAHDHEGLLVLGAHGIEQLGAVVAAALPVGPDEGHGTGVLVLVGQFDVRRQDRAHVGRVRAVLDGEQVAGVVPRRGRQDRRGAGRGSRKGHAAQRHQFGPVHPSAGRSNQTWTWPVPMEFSYSEYMRPGARALSAADRVDHHLVVGEVTLRSHGHELVHLVDDLGVVASHQGVDDAVVPVAGLVGVDVLFGRGLVAAEVPQLVERVAEGARRDEHDAKVALGDRFGDDPTHRREVAALRRLTDADRGPRLVALQEGEEVQRGVGDGKMLVVDGRDPTLVGLVGDLADQSGEVGTTRHVVGHARHAAGQLFTGEEPHAPLGGGDDELHGGEPVAVEDEHQVGLQYVEDLAAQSLQTGEEGALVPVVQFATEVVG